MCFCASDEWCSGCEGAHRFSEEVQVDGVEVEQVIAGESAHCCHGCAVSPGQSRRTSLFSLLPQVPTAPVQDWRAAPLKIASVRTRGSPSALLVSRQATVRFGNAVKCDANDPVGMQSDTSGKRGNESTDLSVHGSSATCHSQLGCTVEVTPGRCNPSQTEFHASSLLQ